MQKVINVPHKDLSKHLDTETDLILILDSLDKLFLHEDLVGSWIISCRNVLVLNFHDTYKDDGNGPTQLDFLKIIEFLEASSSNKMIVSCGAGRSRSGAIALAAHAMGKEVDNVLEATSSANPYMMQWFEFLLGRKIPMSHLYALRNDDYELINFDEEKKYVRRNYEKESDK